MLPQGSEQREFLLVLRLQGGAGENEPCQPRTASGKIQHRTAGAVRVSTKADGQLRGAVWRQDRDAVLPPKPVRQPLAGQYQMPYLWTEGLRCSSDIPVPVPAQKGYRRLGGIDAQVCQGNQSQGRRQGSKQRCSVHGRNTPLTECFPLREPLRNQRQTYLVAEKLPGGPVKPMLSPQTGGRNLSPK